MRHLMSVLGDEPEVTTFEPIINGTGTTQVNN